MMTGDTFIFRRECLAGSYLAEHCSEAETVICSSVHGFDGTVTAQDGIHHGASLLFLALKELKEICVGRVTQDDTILVAAVELSSRVVLDMLRQADGLENTDIIRVLREEHILVGLEELLGFIGVQRSDHVQEGIDKERPKNTAQLRLQSIRADPF
jgi:hypothetical protein